METPIGVDNVEASSAAASVAVDLDNCDDESAADRLVSKLIDSKDSVSDQLMSECSDRAKQIRDKINHMLDTRQSMADTYNSDGQQSAGGRKSARIDTNALVLLQKELEIEISGLNKTSKVGSNDDNIANNNTNTNCLVLANNDTINKPIDNSIDNSNSNIVDTNANQSDGKLVTKTHAVVNEPKQPPPQSESKVNPKVDNCCGGKCLPKPVTKSDVNINTKNVTQTTSRSKSSKSGSKLRMTGEQLAKKLSTFSTDAERVAYLSDNLVELSEENRALSQQQKQSDKMTFQMSKERDQIQSEQNRAVLAKSRLESLCRELQRQNKIIKEESLIKIKEEEEKRRDIANKFQSTLNEIMSLIGDNQKRNTQLKDENADLANKLKTLMGHYETWETHTQTIIRQKELEIQLTKAKFAKSDMILNQEKQIFIKEKQHLIQMITDLQQRIADMSQSEIKLRTELSVYTTKYDEFQSVLTKSNDMFAGFKKDMERMSKQIKKLEKETILWKNRWETSNTALLKLSDEKQKRDSEHLKALQKIITLEKLCRAMQDERAILHERLQMVDNDLIMTSETNGESPPDTATQPATEPSVPMVTQNTEPSEPMVTPNNEPSVPLVTQNNESQELK